MQTPTTSPEGFFILKKYYYGNFAGKNARRAFQKVISPLCCLISLFNSLVQYLYPQERKREASLLWHIREALSSKWQPEQNQSHVCVCVHQRGKKREEIFPHLQHLLEAIFSASIHLFCSPSSSLFLLASTSSPSPRFLAAFYANKEGRCLLICHINPKREGEGLFRFPISLWDIAAL